MYTSLFHENKFITGKYKKIIKLGRFPHELRKANIVPAHKYGVQKTLKNHRSISLLPNCSKIFKHLTHYETFTFFTVNNLIYPNQSKFRPGDSCANQLVPITHGIYKSLDDGLEVKGIFADISKVFDMADFLNLIKIIFLRIY